MSEIGTRLDALRAMFGDEGFLQNKGLSNEVGLYIFAYPPEEEMAVRAFVREIRAEYAGEQDKCRVIIYDLYEILLDICRERRILDRIGQMEKQRGQEFMRQQIQRIAPPQAYVDKMKYEPHRAGDVVIIGGYPSDGKTALALQMAMRMAREWRVGFFSLETDRSKVTDRVIAALNDISFTAIKRRELTDKDWERFAAKSAAASALKFRLIEAAGWGVSDITSAAEAYDFDVVVIDYVQLIRPSSTRIMRSEQVAEISRELHAFAQSRKKLVIELAQLTREDRVAVPKKGKPQQNEPRMSDLKESGQLEQDADMIFMIYRPVEGGDYNPTTSRFLRIVKNKEGLLLRTLLWFDGDKQTFTPMTMETAREREEDKKLVERNARNERMSGAKRR